MRRGLHRILSIIFMVSFLSACELSQAGHSEISITITTNGKTQKVKVPVGSTVTQALQLTGNTPGDLDKSDPPFYTILSNGDSVKLTHVEEKFQTETQTIPFDRQTVRNDHCPKGSKDSFRRA